MSKVLTGLFNVGSGFSSGRHDNDLSDRLVGQYTATLFLVLCVLVTSTTFVGAPIQCWCPAHFTATHTAYANAHCLISPTYFAPFREVLPQKEPAQERRVNYYVWVPLLLLAEACVCALPGVVWRSCYRAAGINVPGLVDRLHSAGHSIAWENRDHAVNYVVHHLSKFAGGYRAACCKGPGASCCCTGKTSGNYLTACYLCTKFLYVLVCIGQFIGLHWFLGMDFFTFGLDSIKDLVIDNKSSRGAMAGGVVERFPKVTMCEFSVRHMHKVHTWVVQCVLPINLFNERIFLLVWMWLLLLCVITMYSLCKWMCKSIFWRPQLNHVKHQLRFGHGLSRPRDFKCAVVDFTSQYLRRDTLMLLRLIAHNVGSLMEEEVINGLWTNFYRPKATRPSSCEVMVVPGPYHSATLGRETAAATIAVGTQEEYCPTTLREVVAEMDRMLP